MLPKMPMMANKKGRYAKQTPANAGAKVSAYTMPATQVDTANERFEICSPIDALTVSKTSLIYAGSSFTWFCSKKAIS